MVGFPVSFLISVSWLEQQSDTLVHLFGGVAATGTVIASFILAILQDKDLDEWHKSASRFANQWGWLAGGGLVAILLGVPPFQSMIIGAAQALSGAGDTIEVTILMAFMLGFMAVIFSQMVCTLVISKVWRSWMTKTDAE